MVKESLNESAIVDVGAIVVVGDATLEAVRDARAESVFDALDVLERERDAVHAGEFVAENEGERSDVSDRDSEGNREAERL